MVVAERFADRGVGVALGLGDRHQVRIDAGGHLQVPVVVVGEVALRQQLEDEDDESDEDHEEPAAPHDPRGSRVLIRDLPELAETVHEAAGLLPLAAILLGEFASVHHAQLIHLVVALLAEARDLGVALGDEVCDLLLGRVAGGLFGAADRRLEPCDLVGRLLVEGREFGRVLHR